MNALSRYLTKKPFTDPIDTKRAEIDLGALKNNFLACLDKIHATSPTSRILAVVKADAYGHGTEPCVRALLAAGCDFFAVSCIEEALTVRAVCEDEKKNADILILGYTSPKCASLLTENKLTQTLLSADYAKELADGRQAFHRLRFTLRLIRAWGASVTPHVPKKKPRKRWRTFFLFVMRKSLTCAECSRILPAQTRGLPPQRK